jgi:SAM-dependent methyltransferase
MDSTIAFYLRVGALLSPHDVVADVGCGRGTHAEEPTPLHRDLRDLRERCARVIGLDVDPAAAANRAIDEFRLIADPDRWPLRTGGVDLVLADFVLEHVDDPDAFLAEAARALRPGGHLCLRTINAYSYVGLAARLVPAALHRRVLARAQPDRAARDVFPTAYRCNTPGRLRAALERHGFDAAVVARDAEPAYLTAAPLLYRLGLLHGRLAPAALRVGLLAYARRR